MAPTINVVTAWIGAADTLKPPTFTGDHVRYLCVTDREADVHGWDIVRARSEHPRRQARAAKTEIDDIGPSAEVTIWMDASFELLVDPQAIVEAAALTGAPIVGFAHPDRQRIRDEADAIIKARLAPTLDVIRQVSAYRAAGFDTDDVPQQALTTTGLLVRWRTPAVAAFNRFWGMQFDAFTLRDQLSVDFCARAATVPIGYLPGHYRDNVFARYDREAHRARRTA